MKQLIKLFVLSSVTLLCSCKNGVNLANKQNLNSTPTIDPSYDTVEFQFYGKDRDGNDVSLINGKSFFTANILKGTKDVTFSIQPAKGYFMPQSSDIHEEHGYPFDYDNGTIHIDVMDKPYYFRCDGSSRLKTYQVDFVGAHCAAYYRSNLENSFTDYHRYSPKELDTSYIIIPDANYEFKEGEVKLEVKADDEPLLPDVDYTFEEIEETGKYILSLRIKGNTFIHITATPVIEPEKTALVSFVGNKCTGSVSELIDKQRVFQYNAKGDSLAITFMPDNDYKIEREGITFTVNGTKVDTFTYESGVLSYSITSTDRNILIRVEAIQIETEYFTVSFNSEGGTIVASQYVYKNGFASKPNDPILGGKGFEYWYLTNYDEEFNFASTPITSDITLHAKWGTPTTCRITFHSAEFNIWVESPTYIDYIDVEYNESVNIDALHKKLAFESEYSREYNNYLNIKMFTSSGESYSKFNYFGREPDTGFHSEIYIENVTCNLDVYISVKTLDDLSWSNIEEYSRLSSFRKVYPVGSVKTVVADNVPQLVRVLDYGHDTSSVTSESLTTFEFVNVYCNQKDSEKARYSSRDDGDPRNEQLDRRLNGDSNSIYSRLPEDLQSVIKPTQKKIFYYDDNRVQGVKTYQSNLFILSSNEMNALDDVLGEKYQYYIKHNRAEDRIKYNIVKNVISDYWTRTPYQHGFTSQDLPDIVSISSQERTRCKGPGYPYYYASSNYQYCFAPAFNV